MAKSLFYAYFVGHINGKIEINAEILHFLILLVNQSKEICEKQFSVFWSKRGPN